MHPRNTDILQSDLALMPPPHLHRILILRAHHMQAPLFLTLLSLVDALQNDIGVFWLVNCDHLQVEAIRHSRDYSRKRFLAYLALEFSEIVRYHHPRHLLLHLAIDPHLQALHVNPFTGPLALAGRNEEVVRAVIIAKAELACSSNLFVRFVNPVELAEE